MGQVMLCQAMGGKDKKRQATQAAAAAAGQESDSRKHQRRETKESAIVPGGQGNHIVKLCVGGRHADFGKNRTNFSMISGALKHFFGQTVVRRLGWIQQCIGAFFVAIVGEIRHGPPFWGFAIGTDRRIPVGMASWQWFGGKRLTFAHLTNSWIWKLIFQFIPALNDLPSRVRIPFAFPTECNARMKRLVLQHLIFDLAQCLVCVHFMVFDSFGSNLRGNFRVVLLV